MAFVWGRLWAAVDEIEDPEAYDQAVESLNAAWERTPQGRREVVAPLPERLQSLPRPDWWDED